MQFLDPSTRTVPNFLQCNQILPHILIILDQCPTMYMYTALEWNTIDTQFSKYEVTSDVIDNIDKTNRLKTKVEQMRALGKNHRVIELIV